ncbi:MAG TPA: STAS domain-containing protein [Frankiaceae bacterium]|jgi:anti-anti-sigma factor|nr:STAS domain-containing protein [Frankiaceae bacterium]
MAVDEFTGTPAAELDFAVHGMRDAAGWTFTVSGDLDLDTVPRLRYALAEAFAGPKGDVIVDLGAVGFFDVTALNLFAETSRRLERTGGGLFLRELSAFQQRLLTTYGLSRCASGAWTEPLNLG